jgi:hypothetical protein
MWRCIARPIVVLAAVLGAVACTSVPLTSLPKLAAMSPETMDASLMEVAVRVPEAYGLPDGSAMLTISVWRDDGTDERHERFDLVAVEGAPSAFLERQEKSGFTIHRLHIDPADAPRMQAFRAYALGLKDMPGQKSLSLSATARPCLAAGANPFRDPRVAIYLRLKPDEDYFTLIKERKVSLQTPDGEIRYCAAN